MRKSTNGRNGSTAVELLKGGLAGAAGVWALDRVTWLVWDEESPETLEQEREARPGGLDPAHVIANQTANAVGEELTPRQPNPAGIATHYALGIVPGALYGALRHRVRGLGAAHGAAYGMGLFFMQDELANWVLGTSGPPTDYPWQAHARGVVGHLALGVVTDLVCDVLDQVD